MRTYLILLFTILGFYGISLSGERVYLSFGINLGYPHCPEKRVVYIDPGPDVLIVKPAPIHWYVPHERIVIIEKGKKWKKHPRWD